jgi:hypothetical protein
MEGLTEVTVENLPLKTSCLVFWVTTLAFSGGISAAEIQLAGEVGGGVSDNIGRTATNARSEGIAAARAQFSVLEAARRLSADVVGDLSYLDYLRGTYDSEVIGNVMASASVHVIPDSFDWVVSDSFGQTQVDLQKPVTPVNRENINYFSTGPDVALRLFSSATRLRLGGRYSRTDYETSALSSVDKAGNAGIERVLSPVSKISAIFRTERIEPQSSSGVLAYDRREFYARYERTGARTDVAIDAGMSGIDQAGANQSGLLIRARMSRKLGSFSTVGISAGREFTDVGSLIGAGGGVVLGGLAGGAISQTAGPFLNQYAGLDWSATGARTTLHFALNWVEQLYRLTPAADRTRLMPTVDMSRRIGSRLTATLGYTYDRNRFQRAIGDYQEGIATAGLQLRAGRRLAIEVSAEAYRFTSEVLVGAVDENRAWIRLRYGDALIRPAGRPGIL